MKDKITYSKCGDFYVPDLTVHDTKEYIIGKYGSLRRQFLKEHHKSYYTYLLMTGFVYFCKVFKQLTFHKKSCIV